MRVLVATGSDARAKSGDVLPNLNFTLQYDGFVSSPSQVVLDLGRVLKIVSDGAIDLAERQRRIAVLNLLRRGPLLERMNKRIQRHASSRNSNGSVGFLNERRGLRQRKLHHEDQYTSRSWGSQKPAAIPPVTRSWRERSYVARPITFDDFQMCLRGKSERVSGRF